MCYVHTNFIMCHVHINFVMCYVHTNFVVCYVHTNFIMCYVHTNFVISSKLFLPGCKIWEAKSEKKIIMHFHSFVILIRFSFTIFFRTLHLECMHEMLNDVKIFIA